MEEIERIEWRAPEYHHKKPNVDFFWSIGLIAITILIVAIWRHDYLFAIFTLISAFCLIFISIREPQDIDIIISNEGLFCGRDKYDWSQIKSFNLKKNEPYTKLLIETNKHFLPLYTLPLPHDLVSEVYETLIQIVPEKEIEEPQPILFMEKLGF